MIADGEKPGAGVDSGAAMTTDTARSGGWWKRRIGRARRTSPGPADLAPTGQEKPPGPGDMPSDAQDEGCQARHVADAAGESRDHLRDGGQAGSNGDRAEFPGEFSGYRHVGAKPPSYSTEPSAVRDARTDVEGALVPDSVVDGFTAGALSVRAASVAGDLHRCDGDPRQDSVAAVLLGSPERGLVLGVVADGVGSEPYSHVGARTACKAAVVALASRAAAVESAIRGGQQDRLYFELVHVIDEVTTSIEAEAARLSRAPRELATTLRAVLVPTDRLVRTRVAFSVGDGATLRLHDSAWSSLQQPGGRRFGGARHGDCGLARAPRGIAAGSVECRRGRDGGYLHRRDLRAIARPGFRRASRQGLERPGNPGNDALPLAGTITSAELRR